MAAERGALVKFLLLVFLGKVGLADSWSHVVATARLALTKKTNFTRYQVVEVAGEQPAHHRPRAWLWYGCPAVLVEHGRFQHDGVYNGGWCDCRAVGSVREDGFGGRRERWA